jgi:hypothetical protein
VAKADDVIESIFEKVKNDEELQSVDETLRELWAAGEWKADRIIEALKPAEKSK